MNNHQAEQAVDTATAIKESQPQINPEHGVGSGEGLVQVRGHKKRKAKEHVELCPETLLYLYAGSMMGHV